MQGSGPSGTCSARRHPAIKTRHGSWPRAKRGFYRDTYRSLRGLGFKGDDHGVELDHGESSGTPGRSRSTPTLLPTSSIATVTSGATARAKRRNGRSATGTPMSIATRSPFRPPKCTANSKVFAHPSMDPSYDDKPSMISETTWNRPNRFRSEAPLFFAVYGALQGSDAIVHFAFDTASWSG